MGKKPDRQQVRQRKASVPEQSRRLTTRGTGKLFDIASLFRFLARGENVKKQVLAPNHDPESCSGLAGTRRLFRSIQTANTSWVNVDL